MQHFLIVCQENDAFHFEKSIYGSIEEIIDHYKTTPLKSKGKKLISLQWLKMRKMLILKVDKER